MDAESIFRKFADLKALVVGDVMIDSYVWGAVDRISPEAPVPVLRVKQKEIRLGGAANVALNVQALGAAPVICSVIGGDRDGEAFLQKLEARGIGNGGIIVSRNRKTTVKERFLSGYQHLLRVDEEVDGALEGEDEKLLLEKAERLMKDCHVVIFQDYDKGVLNERVIGKIIESAKRAGIPTVVDPKKKNFFAYRNATLFKPNLKEIKEGLKIDFEGKDIGKVEAAAAALREKLEIDTALITLSDKGVFVLSDAEKYHLPAHVRTISDVSGAGDTVVSIAALGVALNLPLKTMAELANLGGGLVCEHVGVVPVDKRRLLEEAKKYLE